MATLSESAKAYTAAKTKNIADLDIVDTSAPIEVRKGKDKDGHVWLISKLY
jgi:hypothetical protein